MTFQCWRIPITFGRKLIFRDICQPVPDFYLVLHMYFQKVCLEIPINYFFSGQNIFQELQNLCKIVLLIILLQHGI